MSHFLQDSRLDSSDLNTIVTKAKTSDTCPVCKLRIKLKSSGVLHNHGHRDSPCLGVGTHPIPTTVNENSASEHVVTQGENISSSQLPASIQSKLFSHLTGNLPQMIKWIPRSARQHCASLLTKLILAVVSKPSSREDWGRLLLFGRMVLDR